MKLTPYPQIVARCVVTAALLVVGTTVHAGPAEDVKQADAALRIGDFSTAMSLLRKAADQNDAIAQAKLADLLHAAEYDGEALTLYRKAADQGNPAGEFGLGRMYRDGGNGIKKDPAQALEWFRKAEKRNHAPAVDALARAYRRGDLGLTKDVEQANALEARARSLAELQAQGSK